MEIFARWNPWEEQAKIPHFKDEETVVQKD
jgi:hypothetical protein